MNENPSPIPKMVEKRSAYALYYKIEYLINFE